MKMTKQNKRMTIAGAIGTIALVACLAAVNGVFANITASGNINSVTGYQVNGSAGSSGEALCSNGTVYNTPCTLAGGDYQTMAINGSPVAGAPTLNFTKGFGTLVTASGITTLALNAPGSGDIIPTMSAGVGTSTSPAYFDGSGNIVPAHQTEVAIITSVCTTSATAFSSCGNTFSWPTAFADTNYSITCTVGSPTTTSGGSALTATYFTSKTASGAEVFLQNGDASIALALTAAEIDCHGIHQ
jgi:hypothetical protein